MISGIECRLILYINLILFYNFSIFFKFLVFYPTKFIFYIYCSAHTYFNIQTFIKPLVFYFIFNVLLCFVSFHFILFHSFLWVLFSKESHYIIIQSLLSYDEQLSSLFFSSLFPCLLFLPYLPFYILIYLLTHLLIYLLTHLLIYLLTYLFTYLLTYLLMLIALHIKSATESFFNSSINYLPYFFLIS